MQKDKKKWEVAARICLVTEGGVPSGKPHGSLLYTCKCLAACLSWIAQLLHDLFFVHVCVAMRAWRNNREKERAGEGESKRKRGRVCLPAKFS